MAANDSQQTEFVHWFRDSSPYINAFRNRTFVITFGGEMLTDAQFSQLVKDLVLLNSLGVRLVLVHGARPQIEKSLKARKAELKYVNGLRVTDDEALLCVKQAAGQVRVDIEAQLSMGVTNAPGHHAQIRVVSGNFVTAQPLGIRDGVDYCHTGEVRRVDVEAIHNQLDENAIVLLSPIGYSPTGESFNLSAEDVATAAAIQLGADKLIQLINDKGIVDNRKRLLRELTLQEAEALLNKKNKLNDSQQHSLASAIRACRQDVPRSHIIDRHIDGGLLLELFTRNGCGTLVTTDRFEETRQANIDDIGGLLELIQPLENEDILVRRSREKLETEIDHFTVMERDGMIVGCAALYPFIDEHFAELACLAVHPDYRDQRRGDTLLEFLERKCKQLGITHLFVLTTRTAHWFRERGFMPTDIKTLPMKKRSLYNYQRQSKVFVKEL
ncbi:MAG: amino-acid N-acetyltransferase [Thioalkalispiraceae bacterium]|jgi:amino-acid N-acetyltransferase